MVIEFNVPWAEPVAPDELFVPWWTLVLGIASEHTLDTHTDALYVLNWAPTLSTEKVEADKAVSVDVWMHGNGSIGKLDECDLGRFC